MIESVSLGSFPPEFGPPGEFLSVTFEQGGLRPNRSILIDDIGDLSALGERLERFGRSLQEEAER